MGSMSIWHWVIVLLVVMMVFGTKKIRTIGSDLGSAIKAFRKSVEESPQDEPAPRIETQGSAGSSTLNRNEQKVDSGP